MQRMFEPQQIEKQMKIFHEKSHYVMVGLNQNYLKGWYYFMGIINILPGEISNKIAAGEVVERPASVVKELVENSIDAGASTITVDIAKGGSTYIRVTDNGKGMNAEDAKICFLRHATSKIKSEEDLDAIYTLGFRGEALSSIGAVARVSLYTRQKEGDGVCVKCAGGEILSSDEAGLQRGTAVIVEDLFFNTPARAKFLKKDATEVGYITDIMSRFIFAHPEISFRLLVNGKEKLFSPGDSNLSNAVCTVYGRDYARNLIPVHYENDGVIVSGVIGNGNVARPNRSHESFFVNKRYVKSPKLMNALEEAFKNQIMIGKFPLAVLNIEINPLLIDINVHPTKLEVKFSDDRLVYHTVYYGVKNALYAIPEQEAEPEKATDFLGIPTNMLHRPETKNFNPRENPFLKKDSGGDNKAGTPQKAIEDTKPETSFRDTKTPYANGKTLKENFSSILTESSKQFVSDVTAAPIAQSTETAPPLRREILEVISGTGEETEPKYLPKDSVILQYKKKAEQKAEQQEIPQAAPEDFETPSDDQEEILEYFKVAGQIFDTYIIVEKDLSMLIIDQHAAHERLKYEELLEELNHKGIYSQMLIEPVEVHLDGAEAGYYAEAEEELHRLGFDCSENNGTVQIVGIPSDVDMSDAEDLLVELITQFGEGRNELISDVRQRLLYTVACKSAVKANHKLSMEEMETLVRKVLLLERSKKNTCPHGRPITIVKTKREIEKDFKRIV